MISNVLLIAPFLLKEKKRREDPPLGLAYLASALKVSGHNVKVFDMAVEDQDLMDTIGEFTPQIIGIQIMTHHRFFAIELAKKIKTFYPNVKIAIGGGSSYFCWKRNIRKKLLY